MKCDEYKFFIKRKMNSVENSIFPEGDAVSSVKWNVKWKISMREIYCHPLKNTWTNFNIFFMISVIIFLCFWGKKKLFTFDIHHLFLVWNQFYCRILPILRSKIKFFFCIISSNCCLWKMSHILRVFICIVLLLKLSISVNIQIEKKKQS